MVEVFEDCREQLGIAMGLEGREELDKWKENVHNRNIKRIFGTMVNIKLWNFKGS